MTLIDVVITYVLLALAFVLALIGYGLWRAASALWSEMLNGAAYDIE